MLIKRKWLWFNISSGYSWNHINMYWHSLCLIITSWNLSDPVTGMSVSTRVAKLNLKEKWSLTIKTGGHCVVYTMLKSLFVFLITRIECLRCSVSNSRKDAETWRALVIPTKNCNFYRRSCVNKGLAKRDVLLIVSAFPVLLFVTDRKKKFA